MPYFELTELAALIPSTWLVGALDDSASGAAEMFEAARAAAEGEINGWIGLRYPLPIDPVPPFVKDAAMKMAAEICYARRGQIEAFPWVTALAVLRGTATQPGTLSKIAAGEIPLYPLVAPAPGASTRPGATSSISGERSKVHSHRGSTAC